MYELREVNGGDTRWYYRGNSQDAFKDNTWLYRQSPVGEAHFGKRMRCSACHNSGGPIMKEQVFPYNDWWKFMSISQSKYEQLLEDFDMQFPETALRDADHYWLTPVKGQADINAIQSLIHQHVITKYFAQAVLLIDFTQPLYSSPRCELLKLLPNHSENWVMEFINNLQQHQDVPGALELANYLTNEPLDTDKKLNSYTQSLVQQFANAEGLKRSYQYLIEQRKAVFTSEMSQNPLGQILEPGFRVIFPESRAINNGPVYSLRNSQSNL